MPFGMSFSSKKNVTAGAPATEKAGYRGRYRRQGRGGEGGHEDAGKAARENVAATDGRPKGDPEQPALQMLAVPRAQVRAHARVLQPLCYAALFLMAIAFGPALSSVCTARAASLSCFSPGVCVCSRGVWLILRLCSVCESVAFVVWR